MQTVETGCWSFQSVSLVVWVHPSGAESKKAAAVSTKVGSWTAAPMAAFARRFGPRGVLKTSNSTGEAGCLWEGFGIWILEV